MKEGMGTDLRRLIDDQAVLTEPEMLLAYTNDACYYFNRTMPQAVVLPRSTGDVAKVMKYATAEAIPVTPRGAGSGLSGGATPVHGGIVLDMKRMNRILEIDRANMTATAEAGVVLAEFQRQVETMKLFYPPDPQSYRVCTIGGNVATRAGGPRGVKYGVTSNYVLGLEIVLPDGSIMKTGGKFVKQSAGYNLTQLMTGSEGTLAVITQVNLRLISLPSYHQTVVTICKTLDQAAEIVAEIIASGTPPAVLELLMEATVGRMNPYLDPPIPLGGGGYLLMDVDGTEAHVRGDVKRISDICHDMGAEVRTIENPQQAKTYWMARANLTNFISRAFKRYIIEDVTVPRNLLPEFVRGMQEIPKQNGVAIGMAGHAGDGNLHPSVLCTDSGEGFDEKSKVAIEAIIRKGLAIGGTISGEHGIGLHKQAYLVWDLGEIQVELMKRIKQAFDPLNIMNPGKLWPEEERVLC